MHPYLTVIRPWNCALAATGVVVGGVIAAGFAAFAVFNLPQLILAMLVVFLSTGAGNVLNDYTDRDVDRINHPERPIPSGKIKPSHAAIYSVALFGAAIPFAAVAEHRLELLLILLVAVLLMLAYEFKFKAEGFSGNLIVSLLTAMVFVFGGCAFGNPLLTIPFALISFLASVYREIVKDIEDVEGDFTRKTLPKKVGKRNAGRMGIASLALSIAFSPLPLLLPAFSFIPKVGYAMGIVAADMVFIYSATFTFKSPTKAQKLAKIGMLLGTVSFLLIGLR
ncbi:MAG: UbiA family prenyltransferase [Thermoplasmata archaeon]|nr:UbiA family prenyltransferase [Thermoplasmata archaeon]